MVKQCYNHYFNNYFIFGWTAQNARLWQSSNFFWKQAKLRMHTINNIDSLTKDLNDTSFADT